jgi:antitoxin (DNA-binding transcriptional repressor) of toxin-antitoxin stability system
MTITVAEAQTKLAQIIAQAEAGEEIFIGSKVDHPAVKLVPLASLRARLTRHPDLIGSTTTHDPAALIEPLPPEEWGDLADRWTNSGKRMPDPVTHLLDNHAWV